MDVETSFTEYQSEPFVEFFINYIAILLSAGSYTICQLFPNHAFKTNLPSILISWNNSGESPNTLLVPAIEQGCSIFLMNHEVAYTFLNSFTLVHDAALVRNPNKILVLTDITNELILEEILLHLAIHDIKNVFAILSANESVCLLKIESKKWKQIINWVANETLSMENSDIFSTNKAYLNNRTINLATFETISMVHLVPRKNGLSVLDNKTYFVDGVDGRLVDGFCEAYNCRWELTLTQDAQYGKLYENKSGDGIIGSLLNRQADVGIGGVAAWYHLLPYFSSTSPTQLVRVTCLTPQPKLLPSWTLVVRIYKTHVWLLLVATVILITVFTYFLQRFSNLPHNSLAIPFQVFGGLLLQPANLRVRSISETILSFLLIIFLFLVTNMYLAKAVSMRTFPAYAASVETVDQLAASGIPWNAPHEAWKYSMLSSEKPSIQTLVQSFRAPGFSKLGKISNKGDESLAIALLAHGHYIVGEWITPDNVAHYRLMRESLYWEYEVVWTTKTWPMFDALNEYVMRYVEANLQRYEELMVAQSYLNHRVQNVITHSRDRVQVHRFVSKLEHITGYLFMFLVAQLFGCLVFIVEVIWDQKYQMYLWYKGKI